MFKSVKSAIIPVAGFGTRLLPLTRSVPKELLPLGRVPVLQHVVNELRDVGVGSQVLVSCARKVSINQYFETPDSKEHAVSVSFVEQREQKGLGHAVLCAREVVGGNSFFIALGDAVIKQGTAQETLCARMMRLCEQQRADAAVAFHKVPEDKVSRYGVADIATSYQAADECFTLRGLVEKPTLSKAPSRFAIAARYLCSPILFDYLAVTQPGQGGEIQLTDALQGWIKDGAKIIGVPLNANEKRFDIGNFESYYMAALEYALADEEFGAVLASQLRGYSQ